MRTPGSARVLGLVGELDWEGAPRLRGALDAEIGDRPPVVVLDLSALGFCDSSGLNELLRARCNRCDVPLVLAASGRQLRRLLEVTWTDRVFVVAERVPGRAGLPRTDRQLGRWHHRPAPDRSQALPPRSGAPGVS
ncbi:STAS domain-containing protein [Kitasatospora sp. NPDC059646]|uniref:STAS domain-containing protein n=1 Tax=Kitasatospora sp. NPDC059646 TaxID=3346893 RepID=UPI003678C10B